MAAGATALAGCGAILGEKEEVLDHVEAAAEDLLEAEELLQAQDEKLELLEESAEFDGEAVREPIASARDHLDEAEAAGPRLDETEAEIESLRAFADALEALTDAAAALVAGYNAGASALDSYDDDEYDAAVDGMETAIEEFDAMDDPMNDALDAIARVDPDAITSIEVDVEAFEENVATTTRYRDGYSLIAVGAVEYFRGAREMDVAGGLDEDEDYEREADHYDVAEGHFRNAVEELGRREDADVPAELADGAGWLANLSAFAAEMAATLESLARVQLSIETANVAIDEGRYDDAIEELTAADDRTSQARDEFEAATDASADLDTEDPYFEGLVGDVVEEDFDKIGSMLETLDHMVTGMIAFVEGLKDFEAGGTAMDEERFGDAAGAFSDASSDFGDAEDKFRDADRAAPENLQGDTADLVCFAGALKDGAALFAEGASAADDDDWETANRKFSEGQEALNRCESARVASLAGAAAPRPVRGR